MRHDFLCKTSSLAIHTPSGRPLFRGLTLTLGYEQVAVVGRNGVGKTTLLEVLAGELSPNEGRLSLQGQSILVQQHTSNEQTRCSLKRLCLRQDECHRSDQTERLALGLEFFDTLAASDGWSRGQQRKIALLDAVLQQPDLLLLDEPTESLDVEGRRWLLETIQEWKWGLVVVSHDRELLRHFEHFFLVTEAGGRYFQGSFEELQEECKDWNASQEKKYLQNLRRLEEKERHNARVSRRRARKKNLGRIHETGRSPSRALLNAKRSYAQVSQGRAATIRKQRQDSAREWAKSTRRALDVQLDLRLPVPTLPPDDGQSHIVLSHVSQQRGGRDVLLDISLRVGRDRWAIQGPNGSGKTTLLEVMSGECLPHQGTARVLHQKIGTIAQGAANWMLEDSLVTWLGMAKGIASLDEVACLLVAHKFPLSLAQRPLRSLSPGERLRAALICLFQQAPTIECLLLDEPTYSLDFLGYESLQEILVQWPGGLVVASHNQEFLDVIGVERYLQLGV